MAKIRVRLFHWHEAEAAERAALLIKAGLDAHADHKTGSGFGSRLRSTEPQAIVIDLSRLPSHGREVALYLRRTKSLRLLPLVFVGGEPEKVALIQQLIPGADFVSGWVEVPAAIRRAVNSAPSADTALAKQPGPYMQRWAGNPLAKKLGLELGTTAVLIGAPEGMEEFLRPPEGVEFGSRLSSATGIAILFAQSVDELDLRLNRALPRLGPHARLWICWPKAGSRMAQPDLNQYTVLETARAHGFATSKIVSIDKTWSGLKFSRPL